MSSGASSDQKEIGGLFFFLVLQIAREDLASTLIKQHSPNSKGLPGLLPSFKNGNLGCKN